MTSLDGRVAVVTGASGGIGGAIADAIAVAGATVMLTGRDPIKLRNKAERLSGSSTSVAWQSCDLADDQDVISLARKISVDYDRVDILVHGAAIIKYGPLGDSPIEAFDEQYRANVRGPLHLTSCLIPLLKQSKGQIVFINSSAGLSARANAGHYSATKHALKAVADALREEINGDGVRVLSLFPGRTATARTEELHALEGRPYDPALLLQPADIASVVLNTLTLPRTAEVTNISVRPMQKSY